MYFPLLLFSFCLHFITIQHLFDMKWEGQIYSMLISPVHAQSKSSLHSDDLKSSSHTDWSNVPLHFCSLCMPLANVIMCYAVKFTQFQFTYHQTCQKKKKKPVSFSGWMAGMVESGLLQEWTLVKGPQWREAVWQPVINCSKSNMAFHR